MLKVCYSCGKKASTGKAVVRKGMAKAKGGTGSKIVRATKRQFLANLQKMRLLIAGHPRRVYICTKCMKKGDFQRA